MLIAWKVNNCWTGFEKQNAGLHHTDLHLEQVNKYKRMARAAVSSARGAGFAAHLSPCTASPQLLATAEGTGQAWAQDSCFKQANKKDFPKFRCHQVTDVRHGPFPQTGNVTAKLLQAGYFQLCFWFIRFIPNKDHFCGGKEEAALLLGDLLFTHLCNKYFHGLFSCLFFLHTKFCKIPKNILVTQPPSDHISKVGNLEFRVLLSRTRQQSHCYRVSNITKRRWWKWSMQ